MTLLQDPERWCRHLASLGVTDALALIAVSGGPDSLVLLDAMARVADRLRLALHVGHVDHGIAGESRRVADAVQRAARGHGLPFHREALRLGSGTSETRARDARYRALWAMLDSIDVEGRRFLVTGHHREDQVETILMRVIEGSGVAGLAGMGARRGRLLRPLLGVPHHAIVEYAQNRGITFWSDPANVDRGNLRSWLRHDLLPRLRERIPTVDRHLLRLGEAAGTERQAWNALLEALGELELRESREAISVAAAPLLGYDSSLSQRLLSALAHRAGTVVGAERAHRVLDMVARGQSGRRIELGTGWVAELSFGRLGIHRIVPAFDAASRPVGPGVNRLGPWEFTCSVAKAPDRMDRSGASTWVVPGSLALRGWKAGDRIRPLRGAGQRPVARCLQEARIPASAREGWPVLVDGCGRPLWVAGVCRGSLRIPTPGTEAWHVNARIP